MTTEEKRAFEKQMWDKHRIQIAFKENEQPYDENKVYFSEKVAAAKELFSKLGHPKDFLPKITK